MLCCLKFLYGGSHGSSNVAMRINANAIQLDSANMGKIQFLHLECSDSHKCKWFKFQFFYQIHQDTKLFCSKTVAEFVAQVVR